ncbi:MAG: hypothetical protein WCK54_19385 [Desulfuromonadales bacterium]
MKSYYRTGTLPPDLKSFSLTSRKEDLKEVLHTIVTLVLMAAIFLLVMFAAVPPEQREYPAGWEEVRG